MQYREVTQLHWGTSKLLEMGVHEEPVKNLTENEITDLVKGLLYLKERYKEHVKPRTRREWAIFANIILLSFIDCGSVDVMADHCDIAYECDETDKERRVDGKRQQPVCIYR